MRATFRIDIPAELYLLGVAVARSPPRPMPEPPARRLARLSLLSAVRRRARTAAAQGRATPNAWCAPGAASSSTSIRRSPSARSSAPAPDGIVLVRRAIEPGYGKWVFPGGYVDRGEPLTAAAIREAREESGLDVRLDGLVNVYSYPGRTPVIVVYAATATGGRLEVDDESLEVGRSRSRMRFRGTNWRSAARTRRCGTTWPASCTRCHRELHVEAGLRRARRSV